MPSTQLLVHAEIISAPEKVAPALQAADPSPLTLPTPEQVIKSTSTAIYAPPSEPAPKPASSDSPPAADSEGYLPIEAVDEPAAPIGDWLVDTEVLPRGYTLRMVVLVWISATGNIDKWELDSLSGNKAYALKALVDLDRTAVRPAMRNNIAVPSYRRLEMVVTHD